MIYKYSFSVSGDGFYPERILNSISGDFVINSYFSPTDKKFNNKLYGYGNLAFWHPKKFSTENEILQYENDFIEFVKRNHSFFVENKVTEFEIYIEIYFDGGQCNFEIFNRDLLKQIGGFSMSIPVSVYILKEEEIQKWEDEIKLLWEAL